MTHFDDLLTAVERNLSIWKFHVLGNFTYAEAKFEI